MNIGTLTDTELNTVMVLAADRLTAARTAYNNSGYASGKDDYAEIFAMERTLAICQGELERRAVDRALRSLIAEAKAQAQS